MAFEMLICAILIVLLIEKVLKTLKIASKFRKK